MATYSKWGFKARFQTLPFKFLFWKSKLKYRCFLVTSCICQFTCLLLLHKCDCVFYYMEKINWKWSNYRGKTQKPQSFLLRQMFLRYLHEPLNWSFASTYCNLSRCYNFVSFYNLNSSLAKTQGSLYVHTGKRLIRY